MSKSFIQSVASVLTGTFVAQVIPVIGTLVLARIFKPSSFGIYSTWLGFVLFLSVVMRGRIEMALAYPTRVATRSQSLFMYFTPNWRNLMYIVTICL